MTRLSVLVLVPGMIVSATAQDAVRVRIEASPRLAMACKDVKVPGSGAVSGVALGRDGLLYEVQRGDTLEPVVVIDAAGKVVRSWGRGTFTIPHSVRLDGAGNVWTVDAGNSRVVEWSASGAKLRTIDVGEMPLRANGFSGATDVGFGPAGQLFVSDGYGNARVLDYSATGKRVREWGRPGAGPGEFRLPHSVQVGADGTVYVADRENGRVEKFGLDGKYVGGFSGLGRVYSLALQGDVLWAGVGLLSEPTGSAGWVLKLNAETGALLGHMDVPARGAHGIAVSASGEVVVTVGDGVLRCRAQ